MKLEDGCEIPSWMGATNAYSLGGVASIFNENNIALKRGFVVAVHYPGDVGYEKAQEICYDVVTEDSIGQEVKTLHLYVNARLAIGIGGTERDFSSITLRAPRAKYDPAKGLTEEQKKEGSGVYVLCENGKSQSARIVGFAKHPDFTTENKVLGHNWRWDFNGMSSIINKDGEYMVTFTGAILDPQTNKHIESPPASGGTFFKFVKDGSWTVNNKKGELLSLDVTNKKINVEARSMTTATTAADWSLTTKGKTNIQATGNAVFNSGKKIYIGAEGSSEPLVLGNKLASALQELARMLSTKLLPIATQVPLKIELLAWGTKYGMKGVSPFLSRKGFVQ